MVEARGVEPLSENPSIGTSTSVAVYLKFPQMHAKRRACIFGIRLFMAGYRNGLLTFTASRRPIPCRGTHRSDGRFN